MKRKPGAKWYCCWCGDQIDTEDEATIGTKDTGFFCDDKCEEQLSEYEEHR